MACVSASKEQQIYPKREGIATTSYDEAFFISFFFLLTYDKQIFSLFTWIFTLQDIFIASLNGAYEA